MAWIQHLLGVISLLWTVSVPSSSSSIPTSLTSTATDITATPAATKPTTVTTTATFTTETTAATSTPDSIRTTKPWTSTFETSRPSVPNESSTTAEQNGKGLSKGAIAGICVGVVAVVVIIVIVVIILTRKKKKKSKPVPNEHADQSFSDIEDNINPTNAETPDVSIVIDQTTPPTVPKPKLEVKPTQYNNELSDVTQSNADSRLTDVTQSNADPRLSDVTQSNAYSRLSDVTQSNADSRLNKQESEVHVKDFSSYLQSGKVTGNMFQAEYESLAEDTDHSCSAAISDDSLQDKNWFRDIYPFDYNRVVLGVIDEDPLTDYINASRIQAYLLEDKFITTLGPRPARKADFWRMVWQEEVDTLVMLTKLVEADEVNCESYWPELTGTVMKFGLVKVRLEEEKRTLYDTIRKLVITHDGEQRTVMQYHFTVWPYNGVPTNATALLNFRRKMLPRIGRSAPVVLHCIDGVGCTGTFIALDSMIKQGEHEGKVNIFSFVSSLRRQRRHMIKTVEQYIFLHEALDEYFTIGVTTITGSEAVESLKLLLAKTAKPDSENILLKQYEILEQVAPKPKPCDIEEPLNKVNIHKNRYVDIIPFLSRRVFLRCPVEGRNDYINAVMVDGYQKKDAFYVTHIPLEHTVIDYWRMIYDCGSSTIVVMRSNSHAKEVPHFLPAKNKPMPFQQSVISVRSSSTHNAYRIIHLDLTSKVDMVLTNTSQEALADTEQSKDEIPNLNLEMLRMIRAGAKRLRVFEITIPEDELLLDHRVALDVYEEVREWTRGNDGPVVVSCPNGAGYCGQYVACSNLFDMISSEQEIDCFHVAKHIRESRPEFIPNFEQYKCLHEATLLYLAEHPFDSN